MRKIRNYTVTDTVIGSGGMGTIYKGMRDFSGLDKQEVVACKVIRSDRAADAGYQALFLREAFTAMALAHPHLVQVRDCVRENGTIYLFMEYIDGVSLSTLVRHHGRLSENLVANITYRAAEALAYLHSESICHRDVSPPNILLSKEGHVKVSDFGLARASHEDCSSCIGFKGRLAFACPSCIQTHRQTSLSDVWALLVTAYYAASSYLPFGPEGGEEPDVHQILARMITQELALPDSPFSAAFEGLVGDLQIMEPTSRRFPDAASVATYIAENFAIQSKLPELGALVRSAADSNGRPPASRRKPKRQCLIANTEPESPMHSVILSFTPDAGAEPRREPDATPDSKEHKRLILYLLIVLCLALGDGPASAPVADAVSASSDDLICSVATLAETAAEPLIARSSREPPETAAQPRESPRQNAPPALRKRKTLRRAQHRMKKPRSGVYVVEGKSF